MCSFKGSLKHVRNLISSDWSKLKHAAETRKCAIFFLFLVTRVKMLFQLKIFQFKKNLSRSRLELETVCVLDRRDNHLHQRDLV